MNVSEFLTTVVTTREGYFKLGLRSNSGVFHNSFFQWPSQLEEIVAEADARRDEYDVYFSAHLSSERDAHKQYILPSNTIQEDLDAASINSLPTLTAAVNRTSPGRHQGFWIVNDALFVRDNLGDVRTNGLQQPDVELLELLSKKLAYYIPACDRSGWSLGHYMRMPNTFNHKYLEGPHLVETVEHGLAQCAVQDLELLPDVDSVTLERHSVEFLDDPERNTPNIGPQELLESIKGNIPVNIYNEYNIPTADRSTSLWALMCAAFRAGLTRYEVFYLAKHSANNKFLLLRWGADRDLAKDVVRAETEVSSRVFDVRALINELRKDKTILLHDKREMMKNAVQNLMKDSGDFVRTFDKTNWYIGRDIGRPIELAQHSEYFTSLLDVKFGLNPMEAEHSYVLNGLLAHATNLNENGNVSMLSHFDVRQNTLLLHSGRKDVWKITPDSIERVSNGAHGVVFEWDNSVEPFQISTSAKLSKPAAWADDVFGSMANVISPSPEGAQVLLRVWFMFVLLREAASSRPILTLIGQPGAAKSTTMRRVYGLMYGKNVSLNVVSTPGRFDMVTSSYPLAVFDGVDSFTPWLADSISQVVGDTDIVKRKLYSDVDRVAQKRQSVVAITAHNPRFLREDITDRMLLIVFKRLEKFGPEAPLIDGVIKQRNRLWTQIVQDVQRILSRPIPPFSDLQLRVEDFARLGEWIAEGLGCRDEFRTAVTGVRSTQKEHSLEEDSILITSLRKWLKGRKPSDDVLFFTPQMLWDRLEDQSDRMSFRRQYKNHAYLGKKFWTLCDALKESFEVEWQPSASGGREWLIREKKA